jgi:hypothetical protein
MDRVLLKRSESSGVEIDLVFFASEQLDKEKHPPPSHFGKGCRLCISLGKNQFKVCYSSARGVILAISVYLPQFLISFSKKLV